MRNYCINIIIIILHVCIIAIIYYYTILLYVTGCYKLSACSFLFEPDLAMSFDMSLYMESDSMGCRVGMLDLRCARVS